MSNKAEPTIGTRVQYTAGQAYLAGYTGVVKSIDKSLDNLWEMVITLDKPLMVENFGTLKPHTEWSALWSALPGCSSVIVLEA